MVAPRDERGMLLQASQASYVETTSRRAELAKSAGDNGDQTFPKACKPFRHDPRYVGVYVQQLPSLPLIESHICASASRMKAFRLMCAAHLCHRCRYSFWKLRPLDHTRRPPAWPLQVDITGADMLPRYVDMLPFCVGCAVTLAQIPCLRSRPVLCFCPGPAALV